MALIVRLDVVSSFLKPTQTHVVPDNRAQNKGQDRTGQDRSGQVRSGQDRTGQDRTGQDMTIQDRTGQDRTIQDRTDASFHAHRIKTADGLFDFQVS